MAELKRLLRAEPPESEDWSPGSRPERPRFRYGPDVTHPCPWATRPCPWVSCPWHSYLEVHPRSGSLRIAYPDREPEDWIDTCLLDLIRNVELERGAGAGLTLEEIARVCNLSRERVRQIIEKALAKLRRSRAGQRLAEELEE